MRCIIKICIVSGTLRTNKIKQLLLNKNCRKLTRLKLNCDTYGPCPKDKFNLII